MYHTARNDYEPAQWTLAYEVRGSMLLYMGILVTSAFTAQGRVAILLVLTVFFLYCGDFLCAVPFYCGALLAELFLTDFDGSTFSKSLVQRRALDTK
jgi:hypothetical protein